MGVKEIREYRRSFAMWRPLNYFRRIWETYKRNRAFKKEIAHYKNERVSMDAVMENLFRSKQLYDLLKVKCHPDRFIDPERKEIATKLYQDITENKTDYQRLQALKSRAEQELNVTF